MDAATEDTCDVSSQAVASPAHFHMSSCSRISFAPQNCTASMAVRAYGVCIHQVTCSTDAGTSRPVMHIDTPRNIESRCQLRDRSPHSRSQTPRNPSSTTTPCAAHGRSASKAEHKHSRSFGCPMCKLIRACAQLQHVEQVWIIVTFR